MSDIKKVDYNNDEEIVKLSIGDYDFIIDTRRDLLEACKEALKELEDLALYNDYTDEKGKLRKKIQQAINKAEGRENE